MKHLLCLSFLLLLPVLAQSQTYFDRRYAISNTAGTSSGFSTIVPADSGGYVACGSSSDYPTRNTYALRLSGLDAAGTPRWTRAYSQPDRIFYSNYGGLQTVPGGYVLASAVSILRPTYVNVARLWRFDTRGDTLWTQDFPEPLGEFSIFLDVCRTADGGYALVGQAQYNVPATTFDIFVVRTDSLGTKLWEQHYDVGFEDSGYSITATPDGGLLVGGLVRYQPRGDDTDGVLYKLSATGAVEWRRLLGAPGIFDQSAMVKVLADGNYLAALRLGQRLVGTDVQYRPALVKLTPQGQVIWQRLIGPERNGGIVTALHELANGRLVVAGGQGNPANAIPLGNGYPEGFIYQTCANGDSLWYRSYRHLTGGRSHNYLTDLRPTADGGFIGCGFLLVGAPDTGTNDGWVFKLDSAGYLQAGGASVTVQCAPVGVGLAKEKGAERLMEVWPNPAPDGRFGVRAAGAACYEVRDALGRLVARGALGGLETIVDLARHAPGLYLLRLTWPDGRTITRKLLR